MNIIELDVNGRRKDAELEGTWTRLCTGVLVQEADGIAWKAAVTVTRLFAPRECTGVDGRRSNGVGNERSTEGEGG